MFRVHQRAILIAMLLVTPMSPSNAKEVDAGEHAAATLKQVRSWKPWLGTWEGTIKLEVFPDGLQESRTEFPLRIILDSAEVRVFVQAKDGSWRPISKSATLMAPTPLVASITLQDAGGSWLEASHIILNRSEEDVSGAAYIRTVSSVPTLP